MPSFTLLFMALDKSALFCYRVKMFNILPRFLMSPLVTAMNVSMFFIGAFPSMSIVDYIIILVSQHSMVFDFTLKTKQTT